MCWFKNKHYSKSCTILGEFFYSSRHHVLLFAHLRGTETLCHMHCIAVSSQNECSAWWHISELVVHWKPPGSSACNILDWQSGFHSLIHVNMLCKHMQVMLLHHVVGSMSVSNACVETSRWFQQESRDASFDSTRCAAMCLYLEQRCSKTASWSHGGLVCDWLGMAPRLVGRGYVHQKGHDS